MLTAVYPGHDRPFAAAFDGPVGLVAVFAAGALYRLVNYGLVVWSSWPPTPTAAT